VSLEHRTPSDTLGGWAKVITCVCRPNRSPNWLSAVASTTEGPTVMELVEDHGPITRKHIKEQWSFSWNNFELLARGLWDVAGRIT